MNKTKPINQYTDSLATATSIETTSALGLENGRSVKIPLTTIREGLVISDDFDKAEKSIKAVSDDLNTHIDEQKGKDAEQDKRLDKLESGVSQILNRPTLHKVATSGSYNDLDNKPIIPSAQVNSDWNATSGVSAILNKPILAKVATSGSYSDLTNKPTLHTVATSGSYNDLKDKPTINTNFVPYSDNLDAISDDLGVAWMNVGEGREFGHIYKREQGEGEKQKVAVISQDHGTIKKGTYRIIEDCPNVFTGITYAFGYPFCIGKLPYTNDQKSEVLLKVGDLALVTATKEYEPITDLTIKFYEFSQIYSITDMTVGGSKSNVGFQVNSLGSYKLQNENGDIIYTDHALKLGVFGNDLYLASDGNYYVNGYCLDKLGLSSVQEISPMEWKDVYDTSSNIPQLADVATSGDYADLANTPHLYVISCELNPTTSTASGSYDAVMYFNILHNKDTITIDELKSMLLGKRHPATGYKGDDAIVSFVINQNNMLYRTISQENDALIGGFKIHGTYQVF